MIKSFLIGMIILISTANIGRSEQINVCIDQYPPFKIVEKEKVIGGIDIELTNALTNAVGLKPVYKYYPWARCLINLENGYSDFVSGITKRDNRMEYLHYIEPPYKTKSVKVFYINKGNEKKISAYEDLLGLAVGILRGAKYFEKFDYDVNIQKHEVSDESNGLEMLRAKRLDAFITTEEVGDYFINVNNYENDIRKAEYKYEQEVAVYFAISKKSKLAEKLALLQKKAAELKENGVFDRIMRDYFKRKK